MRKGRRKKYVKKNAVWERKKTINIHGKKRYMKKTKNKWESTEKNYFRWVRWRRWIYGMIVRKMNEEGKNHNQKEKEKCLGKNSTRKKKKMVYSKEKEEDGFRR